MCFVRHQVKGMAQTLHDSVESNPIKNTRELIFDIFF